MTYKQVRFLKGGFGVFRFKNVSVRIWNCGQPRTGTQYITTLPPSAANSSIINRITNYTATIIAPNLTLYKRFLI